MAAQTKWTDERIIAALKLYNEMYGEVPTQASFYPKMARDRGQDVLAERYENDSCWPSGATIIKRFGSFEKALIQAGFTVTSSGPIAKVDRFEQMLAKYHAQEESTEAAAEQSEPAEAEQTEAPKPKGRAKASA